jgi:hypothetical protein
MKHIKTTLAAVLAVALTGCASTSEPDRTDYPTLTVLNPTPYVWDNKKSLALNVAKMAEPAGVGVGLKDSDKASDANTGRSTGGERLFGLALMGLSQGVYGMASDSVLTDKAEAALKWKPSLVDLIPVSEVGTTLNPQAFLKLRTIIGERVVSTIKSDIPDTTLLAVYSPKVTTWSANSMFLLGGEGCHEAIKFQSSNGEGAPKYLNANYSDSVLETTPFPNEYCELAMKISVAGTTVKNGVENYIVVSEIRSGHSFITHIDEKYPGYILIPEVFDVITYDSSLTAQRTLYPHAVVFFEGKPQNFVTPK